MRALAIAIFPWMLLTIDIFQFAKAETFRFDSADDLNSFSTHGNVQFVPASGVADSGALQPEILIGPNTIVSTLIWDDVAFSFDDAGDQVPMSLMFQLDLSDDSTIAMGTLMTVASLRLYDEPIPSTIYDDPVLSFAFEMGRHSDNSLKTQLSMGTTSNGGGSGATIPIVTPLANGHWYRLSVNYVLGPERIDYRLDDFGLLGTGFVQEIKSGTVGGSALFREATAYAGFMFSRYANVGATFADNFVVAPEPSSFALSTIGLIALMHRRR